jgi:hypothetical protein
MPNSIDGIYTAYLTGKAGSGFAMFVIRHDVIVGSDMLGAVFDGTVTQGEAGGFNVRMSAKLPPNLPLIQGGATGPNGDTSENTFSLPPNFLSEAFIRIEGKQGPLNAKLVKLRDLDD